MSTCVVASVAHAQTGAPAAATPGNTPVQAPAATAQSAPVAGTAAAPGAVAAPQGQPATAAAPPPATPPPATPQGAPASGPPGAYYEEQPAAAPAMYVAQPPLPPLQPRNRYYHDGFYLRMSGGFGYLHVSTSLHNNDSTSSVSGSGTVFDVLLGGTPAPGLVIGGGLLLQQAFDPGTRVTYRGGTVRYLDASNNGDVGFAMIGPMIDAFPSPTGGFHFGGLVGFAGVGVRDNQDNWSGGGGLSLWAGYMWWVSSQWSLGFEGRYVAAWTTRKVGATNSELDATDSTQGFALLFSAAYH